MFIIHHLVKSRSQRIVWLLELLDFEYRIEVYDRDPKTMLSPQALKDIHPLGTSPILSDGNRNICESGAICEYLLTKHNSPEFLMPSKESEQYIDVQFWAHFSEGSFTPPLVSSLVLDKAKQRVKPFFIKYIIDKFVDAVMDAYFNMAIKRNLDFVESELAGKGYLVGEQLSLADVHMSYPIEALYKVNKLERYPNIKAYIERIMQDVSYQNAIRKIEAAEQK